MRKVLRSNNEVAHVWASQSQTEGKSGSMFFDGDTIYSYGRHFPIARHVGDVVLFTTHDYSVTTARHKSITARAVSHKTVFDVDDVMGNHEGNTRDYLKRMESALNVIKRSRSRIDSRLARLNALVDEGRVYVRKFGKEITKELRMQVAEWVDKSENGFIDGETLKKMRATAAKIQASTNARRERERAEYAAHYAKIDALRKATTEVMNIWGDEIDALTLAAWERGEQIPRDPYVNDQSETRLRIIGNEIETSRGAFVPLNDALMLWGKMLANEPINGMQIGPYKVTGVHDGKLVIGCHRIPLREVARMAHKLGLEVKA